MIREEKFLISRAPYAVKLGSFRAIGGARDEWWRCTAQAVWFRRKEGTLYAVIGQIWGHLQGAEPTTAEDFLTRFTDGRYGGSAWGRWDGTSFWGNVSLEDQREYLQVLQPMLNNFADVPPGYDGWWTFKGPRA